MRPFLGLGRVLLACLITLVLLVNVSPNRRAVATTLPSGFTETLFVNGLSSPTAMEFAPDGRLFITQQGGALRIVKNGTLLSTPALSLTVDSAGERGLLGIAFDPAFSVNQFIYVYHTVPGSPASNRVTRFTMNGDVANVASGQLILNVGNLTGATNHNGGALHFGLDDKLYIATGENATTSNAQSFANLYGKILRINSDGTIPTDNPFYNDPNVTGNNRAIWALGLRNPFTFTFLPGSSRMFINDVGAGTWEEINEGIAGANYGWPDTEGPTANPAYVSPLHAYQHGGSPGGCAITGGAFYNPNNPVFPQIYVGDYFYMDYCNNYIRRYDPDTDTDHSFATSIDGSSVDIETGTDGALYYISRSSGSVRRISYSTNNTPQILEHPTNRTVGIGQSASFTCAASGATPLNYQWQRNSSDISGATSPTYTLPNAQLSDSGANFRCVVTNTFGNATSNNATLTVLNNQAPSAQITAPSTGTFYNAGATINFSGSGSDPESGALPASALTWRVDFHHDTHSHPFMPNMSGASSGSFVIPTVGETSANVWYRIFLTATDPAGLTTTVTRDVFPNVVTVTLNSFPPNLQITVDGQPFNTPYSFQGVVGLERALGVPGTTQNRALRTFTFQNWSQGGTPTQIISTPGSSTTYTATFDLTGAPNSMAGIYRPSLPAYFIRSSFTTGLPTNVFSVGTANAIPFAADWNGDGIDTIGYFRPDQGYFYLKYTNDGAPANEIIAYGAPNDRPLVGDWNGDGSESIGIYRGGIFMLRNSNTSGFPEIYVQFGDSALDLPLAGDWDGDGIDTPGVFRSGAGVFYLTNQRTSGAAAVNVTAFFGANGDLPFIGEFNADGQSGIGIFRNGTLYYRNTPTTGLPDGNVLFGAGGDLPVLGVWQVTPDQPSGSAPVFVPR